MMMRRGRGVVLRHDEARRGDTQRRMGERHWCRVVAYASLTQRATAAYRALESLNALVSLPFLSRDFERGKYLFPPLFATVGSFRTTMADAGDAEPRLVVMRGGNITPSDTALLASQCAEAAIDYLALDSVGLASNSSVTRDPSNVFVCDPFDGPIFARLYSAGCRSGICALGISRAVSHAYWAGYTGFRWHSTCSQLAICQLRISSIQLCSLVCVCTAPSSLQQCTSKWSRQPAGWAL